RLTRAEAWSKKPKPKVDAKPPVNANNPSDLVGKTRLMFDLIHLALQTDSTRLITLLLLGTSGVPPVPSVSFGHHDLSHHGKDPAFDPKNPPPLSNLYLSMLQRLGIEANKFGSSTGTLTGLEAAG